MTSSTRRKVKSAEQHYDEMTAVPSRSTPTTAGSTCSVHVSPPPNVSSWFDVSDNDSCWLLWCLHPTPRPGEALKAAAVIIGFVIYRSFNYSAKANFCLIAFFQCPSLYTSINGARQPSHVPLAESLTWSTGNHVLCLTDPPNIHLCQN